MPEIPHFEKLDNVNIIQIVYDSCYARIVGLGSDGELYERFQGVWCYVNTPPTYVCLTNKLKPVATDPKQ